MPPTDPFQDVAAWTEDLAAQWADILELRAANAQQLALRADLLAAVGIRPGDTVVEVGCGTGVLLAELAGQVGAGGRAIGVEPQPRFAGVARRRLADAGLAGQARVVAGSGTALPIPDGLAQACLAQTVLVHVPEAAAMLAEMCRVVAPGGRVASIDQDGDTWTVDHPDKELTRRLVRFSSDARFADGWTGRRLPRWFREAGLVDIRSSVRVHIETQPGSFLYGSAVRMAEGAAEQGAATPEEARRWLAQLEEWAAAGSFFASSNYYLCVGTKP